MQQKTKLTVLWLTVVVGMMLHFNYHISGLIYGIDVVSPKANGSIPNSLIGVRNVFYHLPMLWILLLLYVSKSWQYLFFFVISALYLVAHLAHLTGEIMSGKNDVSQITLLTTVFLVALALAVEHYKSYKLSRKNENV